MKAALISFASILALSACSSAEEKEKAQLADQFVSACTQSAGGNPMAAQLCGCIGDRMKALPIDQLRALNANQQQAQMFAQQAMQQCMAGMQSGGAQQPGGMGGGGMQPGGMGPGGMQQPGGMGPGGMGPGGMGPGGMGPGGMQQPGGYGMPGPGMQPPGYGPQPGMDSGMYGGAANGAAPQGNGAQTESAK